MQTYSCEDSGIFRFIIQHQGGGVGGGVVELLDYLHYFDYLMTYAESADILSK